MTRSSFPTRRGVPLILVAIALAVWAAAPAAAATRAPTGSVTMLAQHGFGDRQNSYAWAMAWFKGKLYVGTGRDVWCVEEATSQFYFSFSSFYKTNPGPNVHCAKNRYALDLRAEIWQYTPSTNHWRMVYRAPADIPNPLARGRFVSRDIAYRGMKVVRDSHGREALFVSGVTADEYIPEIAAKHPPRLLRTYDGVHFHNISQPIIVRYNGAFVDHRAIGFRGLVQWNNRFYVLASTALTGDGAVFEVRHPFSDTAQFVQITPPRMHVFEMDVYDGHLWVGTGSFADGYGVEKTVSTQTPPRAPYRFKAVVTHGAGLKTQMVSVVSMHPFRGYLYVGAVSWYSTARQGLPASELIRIGHRDQWEVVSGDPRRGPDGKWRYPVSGLPAGFGNSFNSHLWRMVDSGGALFVGSLDWSWLLQDTKSYAQQWAWLVDAILRPGFGFDLWKTCDGVSWAPVTINAFGKDIDDFGVRTLEPTSTGFTLGTANHAFGTRIWQGRNLSACPAKKPSAGSAVPAPRAVLTDVQRGGNVISWLGSAGARRYRVERAQYFTLPVGVAPPPGGTQAFQTEDALPNITAAGTPGSLTAQTPVLGPFRGIGTTRRDYFVDRTRKAGVSYEYRVIAETATGATSPSSNVQIVPDPRPPATFGALAQATGAGAAVASMARAPSRTVLARLARLAATARDDQVRELAYRLERRLRYAGVAARSHGSG